MDIVRMEDMDLFKAQLRLSSSLKKEAKSYLVDPLYFKRFFVAHTAFSPFQFLETYLLVLLAKYRFHFKQSPIHIKERRER